MRIFLTLFFIFFNYACIAKDIWPTKPVTIIVPNGVGSTIDLSARYVAKHLETKFNQAFVIENKPGAGGIIGARQLAASQPDGYTFMVNSTVFITGNQFLFKNLNYVEDDFVPVAGISSVSFVLLVPVTHKANTVSELINYIKSNSGSVNYGTSITTSHTMAAEFLAYHNLVATRVPYSTSAAVSKDLSSAVIDFLFIDAGTANALIENKLAKPLMVTSETRMKKLPLTPTAIEQGMPNLTLVSPINIYGPKHLPQDIAQTIELAINEMLKQSETYEFLEKLSAEPYVANRNKILEDHKAHVIYWQRAVSAAGISMQ